MAPKLQAKLQVRRGKLPTRSSPRKHLKKPADGMAWIDVRSSGKRTDDAVAISQKHTVVTDSNSDNPPQRVSTLSGKGKTIIGHALRTRTSPRKGSSVRLFETSSDVADGAATNDIPADATQHESMETKEKSSETGTYKKQGRRSTSRAIVQPHTTSPKTRASARLKEDALQPILDAAQSEADFTQQDSQQNLLPLHAHPQPESLNTEDADAGEAQYQEQGGSSQNDNITGAPTVGVSKKRGATRGVSYARAKLAKGKMFVTAAPHLMRFVGDYSTQFVTEIGVVVRCHAPLNIKNWSDVSSEVKTTMVNSLKESFDFDDDDVNMSALDGQMRRSFRAWRYRMYAKVKKCASGEEMAGLKPSHITDEEWTGFVNHIRSDEFQKRSSTNKINREGQTIKHAVGTKFVARHIFYNKNQELYTNEGELDKIQLFHDTHYSYKQKKWVDKKSEAIYDLLIELREKTSLKTDEIFATVLPSKSIVFRGIGILPKTQKMEAAQKLAAATKEAETSKAREKETADRNQYLEARWADMEKKLETFADMERKLNILMGIHGEQFDPLPSDGGTQFTNDGGQNGDTSNQG